MTGPYKQLMEMTHKFSLGESILQRIAHEIRHRFNKEDDNPLGLVFWQAGVKARGGLTPDKRMEVSATPSGVGLLLWQG